MPLPYKPWQTLRSKGLVLTIRADVGRDALIPPGLSLAQTPRADMESAPTTGGEHRGQPGNYGLATPQTPVGDDTCIVPRTPAPPQGSAGGINPAPTNKFCVSGQTGTAVPHRADVGRDALIPPDLPPPQTPRADMESAPTNKFCISGQTGTPAANSSFLIPNFYSPRSPSRSGCRNKTRRPWSRWS